MKVLYLINYAGGGGTEKYVLNLIESYTDAGIKCYFAYNEKGLLATQMAQRKISTFQFEMKNPFDLNAAKTLARICRQNKIDVIHAQHPRENCIACLSKLFYPGVSVVYTSHILLKNNTFWKIINRTVARGCDRIIAVCNAGKQLLSQNGFNTKKIDVIFNGVPIPPQKSENDIRAELNISKDTFVICALTRYSAEKGVDFLVDTMQRLKGKTDRKFLLLIAGTGEEYDKIGEKIKSLELEDRIIRLGYRTDTPALLEACDLFINLSQTEALSFAIIEALSHAKPVVVTNVGGTSDIVNEKSCCGVAVEYGDVEGASDAVARLMQDRELYEKYCKGAFENVCENFNQALMLEKTCNVYKTLCQSKNK